MRFKILGAMLLASAAASFGSSIIPQVNSCNGAGTSISVTVVDSDTSILCGDKLFNGFSTSLTGGYSLTIQQVDASANIYKVTLTPGAGLSSFTSAFNFNYTVSVSGTTNIISSVQDQMITAGIVGASIPNASTGTVTHTNGVQKDLTALTGPDQTAFQTMSTTTTAIGFAYNPTGTAGQPAGQLLSMEWVITENVVPEPGSMALMGAGLVGLGVLARRRRK